MDTGPMGKRRTMLWRPLVRCDRSIGAYSPAAGHCTYSKILSESIKHPNLSVIGPLGRIRLQQATTTIQDPVAKRQTSYPVSHIAPALAMATGTDGILTPSVRLLERYLAVDIPMRASDSHLSR